MQPVDSLARALELVDEAELMVIGGGEIYALCLPLARTMHLTHVDTRVENADAYFPAFDPSQWEIVGRSAHARDARHPFDFEFVDYRRR
jgi:dihydrofolate reductase